MLKLTMEKVYSGLFWGFSALFLIATAVIFLGQVDQKTNHVLFANVPLAGQPGVAISCSYNGTFVHLEDKSITCSVRSTAATASKANLRLDSGNGIASPFSVLLLVDPNQTVPFETRFHFWDAGVQSLSLIADVTDTIATERVAVAESNFDRWFRLLWYWIAFEGLLVFSGSVEASIRSKRARQAQTQQLIQAVEVKAEAAPEKAKYAWDLARVKLEDYFDRNLSQVNQIFWLAVGVMLVGFILIAVGVGIAFYQPRITPAVVAACSGIISEFIGATFMAIYRSTMAQASEFMSVLERINTVGMAVQVLDSIPEQNVELKNSTRAEIVGLLLQGRERIPSSARRTKSSSKDQASRQ